MKTNFHSLNHKNSSVKRQKGESQNGVSRKQSTSKFPNNEHFLLPDTHTYVCVPGGKKCSFFGFFDVLCFLETCFQGRPFALLPTNYSNSTKLVELIFDKLRINGLTQTKKEKPNLINLKPKTINKPKLVMAGQQRLVWNVQSCLVTISKILGRWLAAVSGI